MWAAVLAAVVLFSTNAFAEDKISALIKRLRSSDDFRVRTQAALALGASKSKRAINPLCSALEDSSTTARAASAAALRWRMTTTRPPPAPAAA